MFNYSKICSELLEDLPERQKEVILRRFGLGSGQKETLQAVGRDFGITRERVRQIEKDGTLRIVPKLKKYQKTLQHFKDQLKATGELRKEETLLSQLGQEKYRAQVFFLLTLAEPFQRFAETEEFHSLWTVNPDSFKTAQKAISSFYQKLNKAKQPLKLSDCQPALEGPPELLPYFVEISKIIQKNSEGLFGLKSWPEINPHSIKDKAFLAIKKTGQPLHFRKVAEMIGPDALVQTTHNELIRDPRFVLVGRGLYALKEWGYKAGDVKDVIRDVLNETQRALSKEEILEKVLKQRFVKKETILLNLGNRKYFLKTSEGRYLVKKSEI